jgi:N-acetylglucosamine-6-phosphate deacetylase
MKNPGWVDLQVNGHHGVDFNSPELTEEQFLRATEELLSAGTAVFLPTLTTQPMGLYRRNAAVIRRAVERAHLESVVPGLHLEGPFLSGRGIGSHNPEWLQTPTPEKIRELHEATGGFIRLLTMSAESPHLSEGIQAARELGIVVSVGHHLAGYAQVRAAADAGAQCLTHLGNACPNLVDRHENPLLAGLAEDRLTALIITDGHHLPPELIKIILRVKGPDKTIVTSDASDATGMPPGPVHILGNDAILTADRRLYNPEKQCLVAAASTLQQCMAFLESLGLLTEEELLKVGRTNAMKLLGMGD